MADDKTSRQDSTLAVPDAAGSSAAPTDVRLPMASAEVSDVKLADSLSASDVVLVDSETGAAPSFRAAAPPAHSADAKTIELKPAADRAPRAKAPMALLPG